MTLYTVFGETNENYSFHFFIFDLEKYREVPGFIRHQKMAVHYHK